METGIETTSEDEIIAIYARVSTKEQDIDKQISQLTNHTSREYDEDTPSLYRDKQTGTERESRHQFEELMDDLPEYDVVVARSVSRIARSIRDLSDIVKEFEEAGTKLEFINEPISFHPSDEDPYNKALLQLLGVFAELEAEISRQRTKDAIRTLQSGDYNWGRAPLGFYKNEGELYPDDDYDRVCAVLEMVEDGDISKRQAAKSLDTSRATLNRILKDGERRELYNLVPDADE